MSGKKRQNHNQWKDLPQTKTTPKKEGSKTTSLREVKQMNKQSLHKEGKNIKEKESQHQIDIGDLKHYCLKILLIIVGSVPGN